jgi:CO/xanthine dehydrogenase Mo-binding subunit
MPKTVDLIVKNGTVVMADATFAADLASSRRRAIISSSWTERFVCWASRTRADRWRNLRAARVGNLLGSRRRRVAGALDPETGQIVDTVPGHWHDAAGAAAVEVDLNTGRTRVLRYKGNVFAGWIVNPVQAKLRTKGGIASGLGRALFEEMIYDGASCRTAILATT